MDSGCPELPGAIAPRERRNVAQDPACPALTRVGGARAGLRVQAARADRHTGRLALRVLYAGWDHDAKPSTRPGLTRAGSPVGPAVPAAAAPPRDHDQVGSREVLSGEGV